MRKLLAVAVALAALVCAEAQQPTTFDPAMTPPVAGATNQVAVFSSAIALAGDTDLTFVTDTLSATKVLAATSLSSPSLISTAAVTITPASGSGVAVSLATTGDFCVNTTQLCVDTSAAKVGVGITAPLELLTVGDFEIAQDAKILVEAGNAKKASLKLFDYSTGYGFTIENNGAGTGSLNILRHNGDANGTTALYITRDNGLIGINSTTPLTKLDVAGSTRVKGTATSVLTGTIDPIASTTVTGVSTLFTTELIVGDRITVTGETRTVTAIASATSLTVDTAFSDNANDTSPDKLAAEFIVKDSGDNIDFILSDRGFSGIGTINPNSLLDIQGASGWIIQDEQDTDVTATELDANDSIAIYNKSNKLVFAYNNAGTITYLSVPLDGSSTTWNHSTTAP